MTGRDGLGRNQEETGDRDRVGTQIAMARERRLDQTRYHARSDVATENKKKHAGNLFALSVMDGNGKKEPQRERQRNATRAVAAAAAGKLWEGQQQLHHKNNDHAGTPRLNTIIHPAELPKE